MCFRHLPEAYEMPLEPQEGALHRFLQGFSDLNYGARCRSVTICGLMLKTRPYATARHFSPTLLQAPEPVPHLPFVRIATSTDLPGALPVCRTLRTRFTTLPMFDLTMA